ncbi:MAG: hypothetical protein U5L46_11315 [Agrobacterium sp.]|nr:hypothetical protein [Agrobacterium sp.]
MVAIKAYINGSHVTLQQLRQLAEQLVEMHNQHEHHALLRTRNTIEFARYVGQFTTATTVGKTSMETLEWMGSRKNPTHGSALVQHQEKLTLLQFQYQELQTLQAQEHEYEQLSLEQSKLAHAQDILTGLTQAHHLLDGDASSVLIQLDHALKHLQYIGAFDAGLDPLVQQCQTAITDLEDVASSLQHHIRHTHNDDHALEQLDHRLQDIIGWQKNICYRPKKFGKKR